MPFKLSRLSDMKIGPKLGLLVAIMTIPVIALLIQTYSSRSSDIGFTTSERDGLAHVAALNKLVAIGEEHRHASAGATSGDTAAKAEAQKLASDMKQPFDDLRAADKKFGKKFDTGDRLAQLEASWSSVVNSLSNNESYASVYKKHTEFTETALEYLYHVGNTSNLILDPDVDALNAILASLESLPSLGSATNRVHAQSERALLTKAMSDAERTQVITDLALVQQNLANVTKQIETSTSAGGKDYAELTGKLDAVKSATNSFVSDIRKSVIENPSLSATGARPDDAAIQEANVALVEATNQALRKSFDARISGDQSALMFAMAAAAAGLVVALLLAFVIVRSITKPLAKLVETADSISMGQLDVNIDVEGENEIGQLAASLRRMQASLRSAIERLRSRRTAA